MNNIVLSTRNIDDFINDLASEVVKRVKECNTVSVNEDKIFLNVDEAAQFLRLTVPTIYSKVSKGELPVIKKSKRLYFLKEELIEYLKEGRKKTNAELKNEADQYLAGRKQ